MVIRENNFRLLLPYRQSVCLLLCYVLIIFSSFLVQIVISTENVTCGESPKLEIWPKFKDSNNFVLNLELSEVYVTREMKIVLRCGSAVPIRLKFEGYLVNQVDEVETKFDESGCFVHEIVLTTRREATGVYKCVQIGQNDKVQKLDSVFVFASDGLSPVLLHGDIGKPILKIEAPLENSKETNVILPCAVTSKKTSVALYKAEREGFRLQPLGSHLTYDPKIGFTLDINSHTNPYGRYKCVSNETAEYPVILDLSKRSYKDDFNQNSIDKISIGVKYIVTATRGSEFVCTSNDDHAQIFSTFNCMSPTQCEWAQKCLQSDASCTYGCNCKQWGTTCSKSFNNSIGIMSRNGPRCTAISANTQGGVVQCNAKSGMKAALMYFVGLNGKIVTNWKLEQKEEYLQVSTVLQYGDTVYFVGEQIDFVCKGSQFVIAAGVSWHFKLLNGSIIEAQVSNKAADYVNSFIYESAKIRISDPSIGSIGCTAKQWNSTDTISTWMPLVVKNSSFPTFLEPSNVTIYMDLNSMNQTLSCEAKGYPQPDILWLKNGEEFLTVFHYDNSQDNVTQASIFFSHVTKAEDGVIYTCNATNPRGTILKFMTVKIRESATTLIFSLVVIGLFFCFGIMVLAAVAYWRRFRDKPKGYVIHFSDIDVNEFQKGNPTIARQCSVGHEKAMFLPYDKRYEIGSENLIINYEAVLGQGEFGIVVEGTLLRNGEQTRVAIKTNKGSDCQHLKALLTELKIMSYIGKHENIVNLLGAVTRNIGEKSVQVVVEHCALGCLESYLRNHRGSFLDEFAGSAALKNETHTLVSYVRIEYLVKTTDLIRWAYQLANGMEYLARKKVVHGDLALRNVLLDQNQRVKITDFGLSTHLYDYTNTNVENKKDVPLPWRWLSVESLAEHQFTTESDVWSYGIALWELFSLAETPYFGMDFNPEFLKRLGNGYRLSQPRYADTWTYSIMRDCWRFRPIERPTFTSLKNHFLQMLTEIQNGLLALGHDSECSNKDYLIL